MFIGVILLCLVVAIMLWLFVAFHLYQISYGYTTNEWSKKSHVQYHLERCVNFYTKWL